MYETYIIFAVIYIIYKYITRDKSLAATMDSEEYEDLVWEAERAWMRNWEAQGSPKYKMGVLVLPFTWDGVEYYANYPSDYGGHPQRIWKSESS